jgi:hypothetical protein
VGWRKLSSPQYTEIARAIDSALRGITDRGEKDKNWRTVRMTDKTGSGTDVRVSDNFEQLSPREQAQKVDEFIGLVRSPTDKFFTYTFWAMLLGPPAAAGMLLLLIAWVLFGFRARASLVRFALGDGFCAKSKGYNLMWFHSVWKKLSTQLYSEHVVASA